MCGGLTFRYDSLDAVPFPLEGADALAYGPSTDIRPGQDVACITLADTGETRAELRHWGYQPRAGAPLIINARVDTMLAGRFKPWVTGLREHRCVVIADGWYEWVPVPDPPATREERLAQGLSVGGKQRYFLEIQSGKPLLLAGLYGQTAKKQADGSTVKAPCLVVVTTSAQPMIHKVGHHRQPIVLDPDAGKQWLSGEYDDPIEVLQSRAYTGLTIKPVAGPIRQ